MKNPYKTSPNASLAELRAMAMLAFADHQRDMKTDPEYKRAHLASLAADRRKKKAEAAALGGRP